jgi:uncharacterized protein involved in exopolysaccharide biosynthesis
MDTIDRSNSNLPAQFHLPPPSPHRLTLLPPVDQAGPPAPQIDSRVILRGLVRNWWRILGLWLVASAPIAFLIFLFIQPTYEAVSLLRIESAQPEIFGPLRDRDGGDHKNTAFLQTQVKLITTDKVLNAAIANSLVVNLPTIKTSQDPKIDLRKTLEVEIVPETNLIRVALELPNPDEAVTIVKSVVQSYLAENNDYSRGANRELTENLSLQLGKIKTEIEANKNKLRDLVKKNEKIAVRTGEDMLNKGTDPSQQTFKTLSESHIEQMITEMLRTDLEFFEAQSMLDIKLAALQANQREDEQPPQVDDKELKARIEEEFNKDPDVQAVASDIEELREQLDHTKGLARQAYDPARVAAQKQVAKMEKKHKQLWEMKYPEIRQRLIHPDRRTPEAGGPDEVEELRLKVAALAKKKERQADHFKSMQV